MKKCICYSLWNDNPEYTHAIQKNYDLIKKYLPDWQIVVYYDSSVPSEFVKRKSPGAVIVFQHFHIFLVPVQYSFILLRQHILPASLFGLYL